MVNKFTTSLYCCTAFIISCSAAHADTLAEALAGAYQGNPTIQGYRDISAAADEAVVQARAAYGPSISLTATHQFRAARVQGSPIESHDEGFSSTAELALSQPLFSSGRLAANIDAATATKLIARENLRSTSQQLILDVVSAFVSLQRDIELYGVAVENYELLLQQRDATAARYRLRDSTKPDLDQTQNRLELAAGRVIIARSTVATSAARYRNLTGKYPEALAPLPGLPDLPTLETLYVEAETHNPALNVAKLTERRSRAVIAATRAAMRPQVAGFATLGTSPLTPYQNTLREEAVVAGVRLTMPLYTGGAQSSALREAIDGNLADQQFVEQARRNMREALAADWNLLEATRLALPRYETAVQAAERAVADIKQQERSGIRTLRDVLDVTNDLLTARTAAVETRAQMYVRRVAALLDAGLLSIDMFTDMTPYDPDSRIAAAGKFAGLPLRTVLEPVDGLFIDAGRPTADVQLETAMDYGWVTQTGNPLQPLDGGD